MSKDLTQVTAAGLWHLYRKRKVSPVDTVRAILDRIEKTNPAINALSHLDADNALRAARASEKRWKKGKALSPLDGVPVTVKELVRVRGWPTLMGSRLVDPAGPWDFDAPSVARLREGGAILIAQTTSPEYGHKGITESPLHGVTRNPWDLARTPGGSSGGAAASVAAGFAPLAIGTDGGGSVRIPSAFCGLVGLKPTFGRVPAWPASMVNTLSNVGPMARTAEDAALMMNLIARHDPRDDMALPDNNVDYRHALKGKLKGLRAVWIRNFGKHWIDPDVDRPVRAALRTLGDLGVRIVEKPMPDCDTPEPARVWWTLWIGALQQLLAQYPAERHEAFDPSLKWMADEGRKIGLGDYVGAMADMRKIGHAWNLLLANTDLVLTPTMAVAAFDVGKRAPDGPDGEPNLMWSPYTATFNLTRHPAITVPAGLTRHGLPVGLQAVAAHGRDALLLRVANRLLEARPFAMPDLPVKRV